MIYVKKHESERGEVIAMCDEELIGRVIEEKGRTLDLKAHSKFYKGELLTEEQAGDELEGSVYSANIVGERAVSIVIGRGLASEEQVMCIGKVRMLQIFTV